MPRFGRRVTAVAADLVDDVTGTFQFINNFLDQCGVPQEVLDKARAPYSGGGRLGYLERVLEELDDGHPDHLHRVLRELVARLYQRQLTEKLERISIALRERGFRVEDGAIIPTEILAEETQRTGDYLDELIARHADRLTVAVLQHHLQQHRDLYALGTSPGAAVVEARQFVEQLLRDIAVAIAADQGGSPDLTQPVRVRQYLRDATFFDQEELNRLVNGIYGYLSGAAHPGIADTSIGRLARAIFLNFGVYLLEKFQNYRMQRPT